MAITVSAPPLELVSIKGATLTKTGMEMVFRSGPHLERGQVVRTSLAPGRLRVSGDMSVAISECKKTNTMEISEEAFRHFATKVGLQWGQLSGMSGHNDDEEVSRTLCRSH